MSVITGSDDVNDSLVGTAGPDDINGRGGADTITAGDQSDRVMGGDGGDIIHGGNGADIIDGDGYATKSNFYSGADLIYGDAGDDLIYGGAGSDTLSGGANNDELFGDDSRFSDETGAISEVSILAGSPTPDNDSMLGGDGDDVIHSRGGADTMKGGDGVDTLALDRSGSIDPAIAFTVDVTAAGTQVLADGSTAAEFEVLHATGGAGGDGFTGGVYADVLDGRTGADTLAGGAGLDSLFGGEGDDDLSGGDDADLLNPDASQYLNAFGIPGSEIAVSGNDRVDGGAGADTVLSYVGADTLIGGDGVDQLVFDRRASTAGLTVDITAPDGQPVGDGSTISGFEQLSATGGAGADVLGGGALDDTLVGGAGADTLVGRGGNDHLDGGLGADTVSFAASTTGVSVNLSVGVAQLTGEGTDLIRFVEGVVGSSRADQITGGSEDNFLSGGGGSDLLVGDGSTAPVVTLVSTDATGFAQVGSYDSASLSADGSLVLFTSSANLVGGAPAGVEEVYVKNLATGAVQLVSSASNGTAAATDDDKHAQFLGGSGKVVFESSDALASGATAGVTNLYIKDLATGLTTLFSTVLNGDPANDDSYAPSVTADGSKVLFISDADNLAPGDDDGLPDVFIKDVATGAVALVPTVNAAEPTATALYFAQISADGSRVIYSAGPDDSSVAAPFNLYSRDLATGEVTQLNVNEAGGANSADIEEAAMSADGLKVVFSTTDSLLAQDDDGGVQDVYLKDLTTGELSLVSISAAPMGPAATNRGAAITQDGTKVAFVSLGDEFGHGEGVYIKDLATGELTALTNGYGEALDASLIGQLVFSADGRELVVAASPTGEIAAGATPNEAGLFVFVLAPEGADTLMGGAGADTLIGGGGDDLLDGGLDNDTASYASALTGVDVDLSETGAQDTGGAGVDTLLNIENLVGSAFNDHLTGSAGNNLIRGFGGKDVIEGGDGNDTLDGGAGKNTVTYVHAKAAVVVNLLTHISDNSGAGTDILQHFADVTGSAFNDTLYGDNEKNGLNGGDGRDLLSGGNGVDKLQGGAGNDTLVGGAGRDQLNGGAGADTYVFDRFEANSDVVRGLANVDVIDLHGLDANTTAGHDGDQAFVLVDHFHSVAGEARLNYQAGQGVTLLQLDTNGDGHADMTVTIQGQHTDFTNFVL